MSKPFAKPIRRVLSLAAAAALAGCGGGTPAELGPQDRFSLEFVDGPADHVTGGPIPPFRIWVLDAFGRRATLISTGTITLDLLDPGGAVQSPGFASVTVSFGQVTVTPALSVPLGDGYRVRARYEGITLDSPPFSVVAAPDVVRLTNPSAGETGLMVDGANNISRVQDSTFRTTGSTTSVGVLKSGALSHEVAAFAPDRRPELAPVTWTPGVDTLTIALRDRIALPITVWIVTGTFAAEKASVEAALAQLDEEWRRERAGVTVGDVEFMDATALSADFEVFAIGIGAPFGPIANGVGRAAGRFNVYIVLDVRQNQMSVTGFGEQSGTAIAVTSAAVANGPRAIGHEMGHNFGLNHTDNLEGFDADSNLMTNGQSSLVMTEGQVFRVHFDRFTPLRSFRTGDGFTPRQCDPIEQTTTCPALSYRVWSEVEPAASR